MLPRCFTAVGRFELRFLFKQAGNAAVHEFFVVQVFGCRQDAPFHALWRPASKKRQGTKSREVGHQWSSGRYGDLMATPNWRVGVTPTGCGRRICALASLEACNGHLGKRSERMNERTVRRAHDRVERDRCRRRASAWERGMRRSEIWLMMCRSCSASGATSAHSRARRSRSRSCAPQLARKQRSMAMSMAISGGSCGSAAGGATLRSARAVAIFSARLALAKSP